jgi:hypothetical protein
VFSIRRKRVGQNCHSFRVTLTQVDIVLPVSRCQILWAIIFSLLLSLGFLTHERIDKSEYVGRFKFKLYCDWRSVGQFVLVSGACDQILITVGHLLFSCCGVPSLTRNGSVIYSYNSLSLWGRSPAEPMTTSYCFV